MKRRIGKRSQRDGVRGGGRRRGSDFPPLGRWVSDPDFLGKISAWVRVDP